MLIMAALSSFTWMPVLIEDRAQMTFDVADCLYSEMMWMISNTVVNIIQSLLYLFTYFIIIFSFSMFEWKRYFPIMFGWCVLQFFVFTVPMVFNNYLVNRVTLMKGLEWVLFLSPAAWAVEQVVCDLYGQEFGTEFGDLDCSKGRTATAFA